jgi:sigma-B regulation protein RsbU (phosphoserine phosphatase)
MRGKSIPDIKVVESLVASSSSKSLGSRWFPIALRALAAVFAAATVLYTYFWMAADRFEEPSPVELGLDFPYQPSQRANVVTRVYANSPAERAGLKVGDQVVAFDGRRVESPADQERVWISREPGDSVRLTILRPGQTAPFELTGVFRRNSDLGGTAGSLQAAAGRLLRTSVVLAFAAVGLVILLLRPEDRNVWLLACFFAGIVSASGFPDNFQTAPAPLRLWIELYGGIFLGALGASFYFLCAVFPARSPIDRRLPWLKWAALVFGLANAGEMSRPDVSRPVATLSRLIGPQAADRFDFAVALAFLALGLVSLAANYFFASQPESRRKIRVIFWGTVVGLGPPLIRAGAEQYTGFRSPDWLEMLLNAFLLLVPASFAYAVFKQRVLDIPVLLQRGARYLLVQRGFLILLCFVSFGLTLLFAASLAHLPLAIGMGHSASTALGAVFGTALLWGGSRVHTQVSGKIDRAFFRNAYDVRVILENLADTSRTATNREALARLLLNQLNAALQPASLAVYLATNNDELGAAAGVAPPELQAIRCTSPLLVELARQGEPWELPPAGLENDPATAALAPLHSGCLVPILGRGGRLVGLLALGPRLSEEPYSGEDKHLLASVASQAGVALENFRLAGDIAEKLEAERRSAREMEIAKDVQTRLLPQTAPDLRTLECAGRCLQARRVGGDYYDFLELGRDQAGLVLADVSGKGVHAALLMANLQAHLRSLSGLSRGASGRMTPLDLVKTLQQVNRVVWKSTAAQHYATLFFGLYDDETRRLTYVNCGHSPPMLLRADGSVERLESTATVIGLFENWECVAREVQIDPGDLLAIFSDGVTEAMRGEEEFGEPRFLEELRRTSRLPLEQVVTDVFNAVQQFSAGDQSDDLTLVVARAK